MNKLAIGLLVSLFCATGSMGSAQAATKKAGMRYAAPAAKTQVVKRVVKTRGKNKVVYQRVTKVADFGRPTMGDLAGLNLVRDPLDLKSNVALVLDQANSEVLFEKNAGVALPIASITKMMTGLVVVESGQDLDEVLTVTDEDGCVGSATATCDKQAPQDAAQSEASLRDNLGKLGNTIFSTVRLRVISTRPSGEKS